MVTPVTATQSPDKTSNPFQLKTTDFINMMVTQLQNQDPLQPTSNQDLLAQMSQIGQLQSQTQLSTDLQSMVLQTSLGSAGNLIGKQVQGLDSTGAKIGGLVNSVLVQDNAVSLQLDNGQSLPLASVTSISPGPTSAVTPVVPTGPVAPTTPS